MTPLEKIKEAWKRFWNRNKRFLLFLIGFIGTLLFLFGMWELLVTWGTKPFKDYEIPLVSEMDYYAWIAVGIGIVAMIGGFLYFHDQNKNFKRFHELIDTDSKALFVRNIDEIEELAVQLGPDYEKMVLEKRELFKVKTK